MGEVLVSKFLTAVSFILLSLAATAARADEVIVFYNSKPDLRSTRHDNVVVEENAREIQKTLDQFEPGLNVRAVHVEQSHQIGQEISRAGSHLRGLIFVGHGSTDLQYVLNKKVRFQPESLATEIAPYIAQSKLASKLTVYFLACNTAAKDSPRSFQFRFFQTLTDALPRELRERVEVISQLSLSGPLSFKAPNWFQRLSFKTGLAHASDKILLRVILPIGGPLFTLASSVILPYAFGYSHTQIGASAAATVAALFTLTWLEGAITRYGTALSTEGRREGTIDSLLKSSLRANRCEMLFR